MKTALPRRVFYLFALAFFAASISQAQISSGCRHARQVPSRHFQDLSGLTYPLENGVRANELGGIGSAITYAGGNTFLALPDRGPNAGPYDSNIDDTVSYINRFHTIAMDLSPNHSGTGLPFNLTPTLRATTLLWNLTPLVYGAEAALALVPALRL